MEEEQLDATKVRDAQREIERRRKTELYEQKNKEAENSRLARNQRALERSMNPTQKVKTGRRLMKRSKPLSQTKVGSQILRIFTTRWRGVCSLQRKSAVDRHLFGNQNKLITNSSEEIVDNKADTEEESFYFM